MRRRPRSPLFPYTTLFRSVIRELPQLGFHLIPANGDMTEAEVRLREMPVGDFALKSVLAEISDRFDFIILDCPPTLSKLTVRSEEHTSELQSQFHLVCRLL